MHRNIWILLIGIVVILIFVDRSWRSCTYVYPRAAL
jgi:hypothetical protein